LLAQPELSGWIDLNVAIRTFPQFEISEIERPLRSADGIYGYQDKYLVGADGMDSAPRELPANIPETVRNQICSAVTALTSAFDLTGAPRIDFLWDGAERLLLCEVNAIPGAWGAYLWQASDVSRGQFYEDLLREAAAAPRLRPQWDATSDGRALRVASTIAAKLS
jgi:D-alanine-D-alanine ligase